MGSLCSAMPSDQESEVLFHFSIRVPISLKPRGYPDLRDLDSLNSDEESVQYLQLPPLSEDSSKKCSPRVHDYFSTDRWTLPTSDNTPSVYCSSRLPED